MLIQIDLSKQLKTKVNTSNSTSVNEINQVLSTIGFVDPVTKETSGKMYYLDLASQIITFFKNFFKKDDIGILSLIDAYCIYNRSRGISIYLNDYLDTISPSDMKISLNQFAELHSEINVKIFKNEMIVIHNSQFFIILDDYSLEQILRKIKEYIKSPQDSLSIKQFSDSIMKKNQLLSKFILDELIDDGHLLLDESDLELRYYLNDIINYGI